MKTTKRIRHLMAVVESKRKADAWQAKCSFCGQVGSPEYLRSHAEANCEHHSKLFPLETGSLR